MQKQQQQRFVESCTLYRWMYAGATLRHLVLVLMLRTGFACGFQASTSLAGGRLSAGVGVLPWTIITLKHKPSFRRKCC